jgi:pentose-5-phosphate-3-epimerase
MHATRQMSTQIMDEDFVMAATLAVLVSQQIATGTKVNHIYHLLTFEILEFVALVAR